jgi:hypothetical protein
MQTPLLRGAELLTTLFLRELKAVSNAGDLLLFTLALRGLLTNWLIVGILFDLD